MEPAAGRRAACAIAAVAVVVVSLTLAWFSFAVAGDHLSSTGFAARNREPNEFLYRLHQLLGLAALVNAALIPALRQLRVSALAILPLTVGNAVLYLATW